MNKKEENGLSFLKKIDNPPFKSFINYRIGTFYDFKKSLLKAISLNPTLQKWALDSEKEDGYGNIHIDMWSYLCDIFAFYQERCITEAFRRTAQLDDSLAKLLKLIDNTPVTGRSASTFIRIIANEKKQQQSPLISTSSSTTSFTDDVTVISQGFQVKSVPQKKGQESIIFETDQSISITPQHNLMKLEGWRSSFKLVKGTTSITLDKIYPEINSNDYFLITDDTNADVFKVLKKIDDDKKSQIFWDSSEVLKSNYTISNTKIYKFTQIARPFGFNVPPPIICNLQITFYVDNQNPSSLRPFANKKIRLRDFLHHLVDEAVTDGGGQALV